MRALKHLAFRLGLNALAFSGASRLAAPWTRGAGAILMFHHVRPYAAGGEATAANIQLRCRRHNAYEARAFFDEATRFRTSRPSRSPDTGCHGP